MRPCMGMVVARTASAIPGIPDCLTELMPRSERARLMDLVKLRGDVLGSRKSFYISVEVFIKNGKNKVMVKYRVVVRRFLHRGLVMRRRGLRESQRDLLLRRGISQACFVLCTAENFMCKC